MEILIQQWDAFTDKPFAGNPAAVVCRAEDLSDDIMQKIAREMNLSETAFVTPSELSNHQFRYRWFTPTDEVLFCGHATLAATFALCDQGIVLLPDHGAVSFKVIARIGTLELTIESEKGRARKVWIDVPLPGFVPVLSTLLSEFLAAVGISNSDLDATLEPWACLDQHMLYLPVKSLKTLGELIPDFRKLTALGKKTKLSVVPFCLKTLDPNHRVHLRCFAPAVGVDEDPVTGAANAPLGVLLFKQGVLSKDSNPAEYIAEQGDFVQRPGRVYVRVHHQSGQPTEVQIGGHAAKVMDAHLYVDH